MIRSFQCLAVLLAFTPFITAADYKVTGSIPIGGAGGWDYLTADAAAHRLYVSHGTEVVVVNLDSNAVTAHISGMKGIHGIALADDLGKGFISDGRSDEVVVFGLSDNKVQAHLKAGQNPDAIIYDAGSKRVFAMNGRSQDISVIDASKDAVVGTVKVPGKPEFAVVDGKGALYVNIEDKNEVVAVDEQSMTVKHAWPLTGCDSPSGLAMDTEGRRLFSVCDGKVMTVTDADSGKVVAKVAIGDGPDAAAFDPEEKLAFSSNGQSGTLSIVKQDSPDKYDVVQTLKTAPGARTMALDAKTHKVYLATADLGPRPAATAENPHPRPTIKPDSFRVLIVSR